MPILELSPPAPGSLAADPNYIPPLENGDRLSGEEFMRRYEAMPEKVKAELINGVVYMASPVRLTQHGQPVRMLSTWLGVYQSHRPELVGGDDVTVIFADDEKVQPDLVLMLPPERGGRARVGEDGYVHGPPELVVEVAASTANLDATTKANTYFAAGVGEYLLWRTEEGRIEWFERTPDAYRPIPPGDDGLIESRLFPGLKLDAAALLRGDLAAVLRAVMPAAG